MNLFQMLSTGPKVKAKPTLIKPTSHMTKILHLEAVERYKSAFAKSDFVADTVTIATLAGTTNSNCFHWLARYEGIYVERYGQSCRKGGAGKPMVIWRWINE